MFDYNKPEEIFSIIDDIINALDVDMMTTEIATRKLLKIKGIQNRFKDIKILIKHDLGQLGLLIIMGEVTLPQLWLLTQWQSRGLCSLISWLLTNKNNKLHRDDGSAIDCDGSKIWCKCHHKVKVNGV